MYAILERPTGQHYRCQLGFTGQRLPRHLSTAASPAIGKLFYVKVIGNRCSVSHRQAGSGKLAKPQKKGQSIDRPHSSSPCSIGQLLRSAGPGVPFAPRCRIQLQPATRGFPKKNGPLACIGSAEHKGCATLATKARGRY